MAVRSVGNTFLNVGIDGSLPIGLSPAILRKCVLHEKI